MLFDELRTLILKKRNIKESSFNAYILNLKKIMDLLSVSDPKNLDFLNNPDEIISVLKDKKNSTVRNYLASIVVFLSLYDNKKELTDKYRELMEKYAKEYNDMIKLNEKNGSQKKNWATLKELRDILQGYKKQLTPSLKKDELNKKEMDLLQRYLAGMLYIGDDENPPIRNDYIMNIISKVDYDRLNEKEKKQTNYLVNQSKMKKFFSFGEYKTSGKYGIRIIPLGKTLNKVLNIWLKYNKSKHLLLNSKNEPMTANGLTKFLMKTFQPSGKDIGASMLRHIYITEKFPPQTEEKQELADKMLHSKSQQSSYSKN